MLLGPGLEMLEITYMTLAVLGDLLASMPAPGDLWGTIDARDKIELGCKQGICRNLSSIALVSA